VARPLRIQFEGAMYHVFSRGNEKRPLFHTRADREKFLEIIEAAHKRFGLVLHAYCLMDNHYHFVIETPHANISQAMQLINSSYNTHYAHTHERVGHLFQGRFKAILVEREEYLVTLSRYVHLNPVRSGLVERPEDYEWSSYRFFVSETGGVPPVFLDVNSTLVSFSDDTTRARQKYVQYVMEGITHGYDDPLKGTRMQSILGSDTFVEEIKEKFIDAPLPGRNKTTEGTEDHACGKSVVTVEQIDQEIFAIHEVNDKIKRKMRLYYLRKFTSKTLDEIVGMLDKRVSVTAVSKTVTRLDAERQGDPVLEALMQRIEETLMGEK